jgi:signal transduction histidine kinase
MAFHFERLRPHCGDQLALQDFPHIQIEKSILLEEDDTPDVLKIVVYRIIQEALNNVAKHSGAYRVAIVLGKNSWGVELETRDNGKGFDVAEAHGLPEQTPESAFPE